MTNAIDNSNLTVFKESNQRGDHRYRFQTTDKQLHVKMRNRNSFSLTAVGSTSDRKPIWIYYNDCRDNTEAKRRFKSLSSRAPKYSTAENLFY